MNDRTRSLWVPGLVSLTAAMAFLMFLQLTGVQPRFIWLRSGPPLMLYSPWLIAQPLFGAIGAYLSRRAGGERRACLIAGLFPAMVMLGLFSVGLAVKIVVLGKLFSIPLAAVLGQTCFWIILPGFALLFGTLPFLKTTRLQTH